MSEIPDEITKLSNAELRKELLRIGIAPAPLTPTSKRLYQKKLAQKLYPNNCNHEEILAQKDKNETASCVSIKRETRFPTVTSANSPRVPTSLQADDEGIRNGMTLDAPSCYYVVLVPSAHNTVTSTICGDRSSALKLLRSTKGSRFKQFPSISQAEDFAHNYISPPDLVKPDLLPEKPNDFPTPRQVELTRLMRAIESNDVAMFDEMVWNNPRFLISAADGPVPLKPNTRYNALHIAARSDQAEMVRRVLSTLESSAFYDLMYSFPHAGRDRVVEHVLDLYLNTPEKGCYDTPLHIACKFGYTDHYYVPLVRCHDDTEPPTVGRPWNPSCPLSLRGDGKESSLTAGAQVVTAIAGPMSRDEAWGLHRKWATPDRKDPQARQRIALRLRDADRGDERVGREVARQEGHQWLEYWDFLQNFADVSTEAGLSQLEDYLCHKDKNTSLLLPSSDVYLSDLSGQMSQVSLTSPGDHRLGVHHTRPVKVDSNTIDPCPPSPPVSDPFDPCPPSPPVSDPLRLSAKSNQFDRLKDAFKWRQLSRTLRPLIQPNLPRQLDASPPSTNGLNSSMPHPRRNEADPRLATASYNDVTLFLAGSKPTKVDHDVLLALSGCEVDPLRYPLIRNWMDAVQSYPEPERTRWKTPRKKPIRRTDRNRPVPRLSFSGE